MSLDSRYHAIQPGILSSKEIERLYNAGLAVSAIARKSGMDKKVILEALSKEAKNRKASV